VYSVLDMFLTIAAPARGYGPRADGTVFCKR
jgi:hypothetical protein